jgi:hypothetical protein
MGLGILIVLQSEPAGAIAGIDPPDVPSANIAVQFGGPCANQTLDESAGCGAFILSQIDADRSAERTGPMNLPSNYDSLDITEQMFVVTELERVDRGLPPLLGITQQADQAAELGAIAGTDPSEPSGSIAYTADWASGASPLQADLQWMYQDGCGVGPSGGAVGNNGACQPTTPWNIWPSWGHRLAILSSLTLPGCATCVAGAGYSTAPGYPSYALVIASPASANPSLIFSWALDVRPFLSPQSPGCANTDVSASQGYVLVGADGGTFAFGNVHFSGSLGGTNPSAPVVGIATTPDHGGYWLVDDSGDVYAFGDAPSLGNVLNNPNAAGITFYAGKIATAIAGTHDGKGYWVVDPSGDVISFGDAVSYGSLTNQSLNSPIVGMMPTADGGGYWLVASDGGVFAFGDAGFIGSMGGQHLNLPVVGMASDAATGGYWLVAADGGIFAFGAPFFGSMGGQPLFEGVAGMVDSPDGLGYRLVAYDGGTFNFGDAMFEGSAACLVLGAPVVAVAD